MDVVGILIGGALLVAVLQDARGRGEAHERAVEFFKRH